jgi:zinc-binding alcohol dehydrogenase/oxidoreductase
VNAIVLHSVGEPEALRVEEVPDPTPGPGQVVVRLRAAALNHRDLFICRGQYAGIRFPIIPGSDGAGEVAAVGPGVTGVVRGAPVVINPSLEWGDDPRAFGPRWRILGLPDNGTFAEQVAVPAANVLPAPEGLSDEEAAAIPLAGLTAYRALVTRGHVQRGETVLVLGIGGGVATCALLIARHAGARVLVTSGTDAKLARAQALGAEGGFNYKTTDWVAAAREATGGRGPELIIDGTGGETFERALDAARPGGRVVTYGATTGNAPQLTVRRVFWKQLSVLGSTMGTPDDFRAMLALFGKDKLRPVVDQVFPLADAGRALRRMEEAAQFGKIVLRITPP